MHNQTPLSPADFAENQQCQTIKEERECASAAGAARYFIIKEAKPMLPLIINDPRHEINCKITLLSSKNCTSCTLVLNCLKHKLQKDQNSKWINYLKAHRYPASNCVSLGDYIEFRIPANEWQAILKYFNGR